MATDKWLESLQKVAPIRPPEAKAAMDPLLAAGPFDTGNDDEPTPAVRMSKVHDDGFADGSDFVGDLIRNGCSKLKQRRRATRKACPRRANVPLLSTLENRRR